MYSIHMLFKRSCIQDNEENFVSNIRSLHFGIGFVHLAWMLPVSSIAFLSCLRQWDDFERSQSVALSDWQTHCCGSPSEYIFEY